MTYDDEWVIFVCKRYFTQQCTVPRNHTNISNISKRLKHIGTVPYAEGIDFDSKCVTVNRDY